MKKLVVSGPARSDLEGIAAFTEAHWGEAKKAAYLNQLKDRLRELLNNPRIGKPRDEICARCRSLPAGRHVIFYRESETGIEILRLLHERMEPAQHLTNKKSANKDR